MVNENHSDHVEADDSSDSFSLSSTMFQDRKDRPTGKDSKTIKQLLGELYADKEYLEKLWEETGEKKNPRTDQIHAKVMLHVAKVKPVLTNHRSEWLPLVTVVR